MHLAPGLGAQVGHRATASRVSRCQLSTCIRAGQSALTAPAQLTGPSGWRAGNTNAADLLRQLRSRGYAGSGSVLRQYVRPWRTVPPDPQAGTLTRTGPISATTREVTCRICTRREDLEHDQAAGLAAVLGRCEHLDRLTGHVRAFARLLTTLAGEQLNAWVRAVQDDTGQPRLMSFVRGVLAGYDAVRAGSTESK